MHSVGEMGEGEAVDCQEGSWGAAAFLGGVGRNWDGSGLRGDGPGRRYPKHHFQAGQLYFYISGPDLRSPRGIAKGKYISLPQSDLQPPPNMHRIQLRIGLSITFP